MTSLFSTRCYSGLALFLFVVMSVSADEIGDELNKAKTKYAKSMTTLKQTTLDEIDAIIRREQDAGSAKTA